MVRWMDGWMQCMKRSLFTIYLSILSFYVSFLVCLSLLRISQFIHRPFHRKQWYSIGIWLQLSYRIHKYEKTKMCYKSTSNTHTHTYYCRSVLMSHQWNQFFIFFIFIFIFISFLCWLFCLHFSFTHTLWRTQRPKYKIEFLSQQTVK